MIHLRRNVLPLVVIAATGPCVAEQLIDVEEPSLTRRLVVDADSIHNDGHLRIVDLMIVYSQPVARKGLEFNRQVLRNAFDCRDGSSVLVRQFWYLNSQQVDALPETLNWRNKLTQNVSPHSDGLRRNRVLDIVCRSRLRHGGHTRQ